MQFIPFFARFAPSGFPRQQGGSRWLAFSLALGLAALWGGSPALAATRLPADPTPTPKAGPSFAIINPLYNNVAEGPVLTNVTVQATSGWTPTANITLSLAVESQTCDPRTAIPVSVTGVTVDQNGAFTATFAWPTAANQNTSATYVVCANESGAGTQVGRSTNVFNVMSNQAPTISVSPLTAHAGDMVQVNGTNWLPSGEPITLTLQGVGLTFQRDPGEKLNPNQLLPDNNGNFTVSVTLPLDRIASSSASNAQNIVATMGTPSANSTTYPLFANTQPLNILQPVANTPAPTLTPLPATVTPTNQNLGASNPSNNTEKLLIGLLGLIAVVLLLAGIIVAVLALRGRNPAQATPPIDPRRPSGGFGGGYGGYPLDQSDATVADGPDWQSRNWNDEDRWQPPGGRPWSGSRANPPYDGRNLPPPVQPSAFDDEDDRYRTRMGDPYQSAPPAPRPMGPPPQSRPMGPPPQSRPMPPRPNASRPAPNWNDDPSNQDTGPGPTWPPPRQ